MTVVTDNVPPQADDAQVTAKGAKRLSPSLRLTCMNLALALTVAVALKTLKFPQPVQLSAALVWLLNDALK